MLSVVACPYTRPGCYAYHLAGPDAIVQLFLRREVFRPGLYAVWGLPFAELRLY